MCNPAAVTYHVKPRISGLKPVVKLHLHIVELDLHPIKKSVVIGCSRSYPVQGMDHLNDTVQYPFRKDQAQIPGLRLKGRGHKALLDPLMSAPPSPDQIPEALKDDPSSEHVRKPCYRFSVSVAVAEGLGKVLGHQKGKVGILRPLFGILIAVSVNRYDPVGILIDNAAVGVHTEGTHLILKLFRPVYDLALIQLIRQMGKDLGGELHSYADIHAIRLCGYVKALAGLLHPLAAASAHGDDAVLTDIFPVPCRHPVPVSVDGNGIHGSQEMKIRLFRKLLIHVFKNNIIDVGPKVPHAGIKELQLILHAGLLQDRIRRRVELRSPGPVL